MSSLLLSLRHAVRRLGGRPSYTASVVLTLAMGITAITFVSAIGYGVLMRPLPFPAPDRLGSLSTTDAAGRPGGTSLPDVEDWRHETTSFESIGAYIELDAAIEAPAGVEPVRVAAVDHQFFEVLGAAAAQGRFIGPEDDRVPTIVLSWPAWRRLFAASGDVTGRRIRLNGEPATVIGVAPPEMTFPTARVEAWIPLAHAREIGPPQWSMRGFRGFRAIARLRPDRTIAAASADILRASTALSSAYPRSNTGVRASVTSLSGELAAPVRPSLMVLWAAAFVPAWRATSVRPWSALRS